MNLYDLTPLEKEDSLYIKRDDYFKPFGNMHVNGGKVRQALLLFENMIEEIRNKHNNGVITAASVYSPQSANIAKVAQHYGVKCISCVGGTTEEMLKKHHMMTITQHYGSEIKIVAKHGMPVVIHAKMHELSKENGYLPIEMGELLKVNPKAIFESTAYQVQNIPDEIDTMIVPCGVAIQLCGILVGLKRYNKKVKQIFAICVGPQRAEKLNSYLSMHYAEEKIDISNVNWVVSPFAYGKELYYILGSSYIDDIYESKAYHWYLKEFDKQGTNLFWCVGRRPNRDEVKRIIMENL